MKCSLITALLTLAATVFALDKPNIVFIYGDDIGYGDFSCYGGEIDTANVDTLAEEGVRFTSGYCTAATCTPSRYSLLTGEYAFRNKSAKILPGNAPLIIDPSRPTIATFLRDNGYKTMVSGKWHLGLGSASNPLDWNGEITPGPREVGFDESFHMAATADRVPSVYIHNGRVVNLDPNDPLTVSYQQQVGDDPTGISDPQLLKVQADAQHSGTIVNGVSRIGWMSGGNSARFRDEDMADTYLQKAVEFIRKEKDSPFFLYYAPNECHVPRILHQRFKNATAQGPRGDALAVFDWCVGRIVETLKATGQYDNTLIVVTSDNGPVLFDGYWEGGIEKLGRHDPSGPWRGGKYSRWEGGTRVSFIVSWPGKTNPGISDAMVSQVDLYASIAAILGKEVPENAGQDGQNMLPVLLGKSHAGRDYIIEEALTQIAVRKDNWKYVPPGSVTERLSIMTWKEGSGWKKTLVEEPGLLFNLTEDPTESRDLAAKYPNRVQELRNIIMQVAPGKATGQKKLDKKQLGF